MRGSLAIGTLGIGLLLSGCIEASLVDDLFTEAEWMKASKFSPMPTMPVSLTNSYADNEAAAALGHKLFFDKRYSGQITVEGSGPMGETGHFACTSCHDPKRWFIDTRSKPGDVSYGAQHITKRNAPSMVNVSYYTWGGWAGAQDQFWKQGANAPETRDLGGDRLGIAHLIFTHYRSEYAAIFGEMDTRLGDMELFPANGKPGDMAWEMMGSGEKAVVNRIMANVGKVMEAYERRLTSHNAPIDKYLGGKFDALSSSAKRGLKLFIGKAGCDVCHQDQTFTDQDFHNTGLKQKVMNDMGRYEDFPRLMNPFNGAGMFSDNQDAGAEKLAGLALSEEMRGQFRTKSLRHVAHTGPFFHDGSAATLEAVVRFYNRGGDSEGFPGVKDARMVPLNLTEGEIFDLVAFLEALTGEPVPDQWTNDPFAQ